ncbi:MAG: ATP-binding cassette domain-containing protein, partial [Polyangiaceae bacterium]
MRRRVASVAVIAVIERLLGPVLAFAVIYQTALRAALVGVGLSGIVALRGAIQRSFSARNEAELYGLAVDAVLAGDVLQRDLLPDEEARISLFQGLHRIAVLVAETLPNLAADLVAAIVVGIVSTLVEPPEVMVVAAVTAAVGGSGLFLFRRWVHRAHVDAWQAWDRVAEGVTDACEGRLEIVAGGVEGEFLRRFARVAAAWDGKARRAGRIAGLLGRVPIALLAVAVGGAVVADASIHGASWPETVGRAVLLASTAPAFLGIARGLQEVFGNAQRLRLASRVVASTRTRPEVWGLPGVSPERIRWDAVRFRYSSDGDEVLHDVSFEWKRGEVLALAGPNGSGKSACLGALLGLGSVLVGGVKVDGVPLTDLGVVGWRRAIAFLPQRPYMPAQATVRACMRFVDFELTDEAMLSALARVGVVDSLRRASAAPLDARVGRLSTGERQRVALA